MDKFSERLGSDPLFIGPTGVGYCTHMYLSYYLPVVNIGYIIDLTSGLIQRRTGVSDGSRFNCFRLGVF